MMSRIMFAAALVAVMATVAVKTSIGTAASPKAKLSTPTIQCIDDNLGCYGTQTTDSSLLLEICAGASGVPAGFSVQWMTCAEYAEHQVAGPDGSLGTEDDITVYDTWYDSDDPRLCKASFSANAKKGDPWNLPAKGCVCIVIGGLYDLANSPSLGVSTNCGGSLACDTCYVVRVFAHATSSSQRSDFSETISCTTDPCTPTECCMYSHGYFKHQCDPKFDTYMGPENIELPCATLNVCTEVTKNYGGPDLSDARGRLGYQIIAVYLSLDICDASMQDPAYPLLMAAINEYCNSMATKTSLSAHNATLSAYICSHHCGDDQDSDCPPPAP